MLLAAWTLARFNRVVIAVLETQEFGIFDDQFKKPAGCPRQCSMFEGYFLFLRVIQAWQGTLF